MRRSIEERLIEAAEGGEACSLGIIVAAKGSTPQRPGAKALFFADGRVEGTLGGGCLEAEACRRALGALREGTPLLFDLGLDDDFGWDDGLLCGGTARVFVRPVTRDLAETLRPLLARRAERTPAVLAAIVGASSPGIAGRFLILDPAGVAAGEAPPDLAAPLGEAAARALEREAPALERIDATHSGTKRGGAKEAWIEVFLDPQTPHPVLIIAGAGHVGEALARLAAPLGFDVTVIDDRAAFAKPVRFPEASHILVGDIAETLARQSIDASTYVVIVTRGHRHDASALRACLARPVRYIGMIGSRRKIGVLFRALQDEGAGTAEALARVHAPIGLAIGAVTVEEIAASIAAELVAVRRKGSADEVRSMRASRGTPA
ncbi:MAG: XdhC family protein, partial [Planctomycetes bacterium]|nr:XdhC family protein [Planctomycetota bacterium]